VSSLASTAPTSTPSGRRCSTCVCGTSSATLLLPTQWSVCCIDRLNPPLVLRVQPLEKQSLTPARGVSRKSNGRSTPCSRHSSQRTSRGGATAWYQPAGLRRAAACVSNGCRAAAQLSATKPATGRSQSPRFRDSMAKGNRIIRPAPMRPLFSMTSQWPCRSCCGPV